MDASARGLWLLPTLDRATTNLPRFFAAAKKTGMSTPGAVVVEQADFIKNAAAYKALELPANWRIHLVEGGCCALSTEQARRDLFTDDMQWLGWLADDLVPETPGWDVKVIESLNGWNCVGTDDGLFAPKKFNGATAWSGDLVRAVGYLYPPGLRHYYIDTAWEELGEMMGIRHTLMDVLVRHAHAARFGAADPTLKHTNSFWHEDERAFIAWKNNDRLAVANRIGEVLVKYGVARAMPDLKGLHIMIATPCGSGMYERLFVSSLWSTIDALRQCGAVVNFMEHPYNSDIALARAKLFGMFMRSDATHLFFIDDDMGWRPADAVMLFSHKRDFIAVAGPRKVFPPSFAVRCQALNGGPMPLRQEGASGLFEVSHVGMAFAIITKKCAQRVVDAHPELEFSGDDGRTEYAVFNPVVVNRRYMSEDFAFCERWRQTGGKVHIEANVSLQHVGKYVWEGAWLPTMIAEQQKSHAA